jgi:menaquinone-dependent protoporphyrinogen oxidase
MAILNIERDIVPPKEFAMNLLVAVASKHESTWEIAQEIGKVLVAAGQRATVAYVDEAYNVHDYDAIVLGSAVYAGHWMRSATQFAEAHTAYMANHPAWLFSGGPVGDPPCPHADDSVDVRKIVARVHPIDHHIFAGRRDRHRLSFAERAVTIAVRAPEGDFRNWATQIATWLKEVSDRERPVIKEAGGGHSGDEPVANNKFRQTCVK